jgi:hypothetical protein
MVGNEISDFLSASKKAGIVHSFLFSSKLDLYLILKMSDSLNTLASKALENFKSASVLLIKNSISCF